MITAAHWLVYAGALGETLFVLLFGIGSWRTWWREPIGRALMASAVGLALSLDLIAAFYTWGDYPGRAWVSLGAFAVVVVGIYWQLGVFVKIRYRRSNPRAET